MPSTGNLGASKQEAKPVLLSSKKSREQESQAQKTGFKGEDAAIKPSLKSGAKSTVADPKSVKLLLTP